MHLMKGSKILAINAGSTSLKFALFSDTLNETHSGSIDWAQGGPSRSIFQVQDLNGDTIRNTLSMADGRAAAGYVIEFLAGRHSIGAVGHRIVHGGTRFHASQKIDGQVKKAVADLCDIAPLHNPPALAGIEAAEKALPGVEQIAVFDTAFFARMEPRAFLYPVPYEWYEQHGIRRIGFHGISNAYCEKRALNMLGGDRKYAIVICHLGGGCSATGIYGGTPVATTMGMTPLEGLMMGSRCGSIDPGILLELLRKKIITLEAVDDALNHRSGLLGISGVSADLASIEKAASDGNERAWIAFEMFTDRVRSAIGALAVSMGGVDALVFTDRIGENSPKAREAICSGLQCLSISICKERNWTCKPDADIAEPDSKARILVIHTREEYMIASETRDVISKH